MADEPKREIDPERQPLVALLLQWKADPEGNDYPDSRIYVMIDELEEAIEAQREVWTQLGHQTKKTAAGCYLGQDAPEARIAALTECANDLEVPETEA